MTREASCYETTIDCGALGELDLEVYYFYTPEQPGRFDGPPEDCYPTEPEEFEVEHIHFPYETLPYTTWECLTESTRDAILNEIRDVELEKLQPEEPDDA